MPKSLNQSSIPIAELKLVLDLLPCGAGLVHRDGTVLHLNPVLIALTRWDPTSLIGMDFADIWPESERSIRRGQFELLLNQGIDRELYLPTTDGESVSVMLAARSAGPSSSPLADVRVITVTDISGQKKAMEIVTQLSDTVITQAVSLKHHAETLEQRVQERTVELHEANLDAIYMLAVASEAKDQDTGSHVRRIESYAACLANSIGLSSDECANLAYSAILHDVGKIHVPDSILKKPGRLDDGERTIMQTHTTAGENILSNRSFFELARQIARSHHENWDGSGYPDGLIGDEIPLAARIVHLVDVYDALTSQRVYKPAWTINRAVEMIRGESGRAFEPLLVECFLDVLHAGAFDDPAAVSTDR